MKIKIIKFLIWVFLAVGATYFTVFNNGTVDHDWNTPRLTVTLYAIAAVFVWGIYRKALKSESMGYASALVVFLSIIFLMLVVGHYLSPTQMVAIIALFFYVSKILRFSFKK